MPAGSRGLAAAGGRLSRVPSFHMPPTAHRPRWSHAKLHRLRPLCPPIPSRDKAMAGHRGRRAEGAPFLPSALKALPAHPAAAAGQRTFRKLPLVVTSAISTAPPRSTAARWLLPPQSRERGLAVPGFPCAGLFPSCTPEGPPQTLIWLCRRQQNRLREGSFPGSLASSAARRGCAPPWPGRALPAPRWAPRDRAASAELPPSPLAARARAETWKGAETSDFQQPLAGFPCIDSIPALPRLLTDSPQHSCAAEDAAEEPHAPQTPRGSAGIIGKLRYRVSK